MISVRRPTPERVEQYRQDRLHVAPTALPTPEPPPGFRRETFERVIGVGPADLEWAKIGLRQWAAHRGSGVAVHPADAELAPGTTVAIVTQQLGLWVLAACRIVSVIDQPTRFGFVYATLPDHPERGYESFLVRDVDGEVVFEVEAVSQPGIPVVRFGSPVTRVLQRRATEGYLAAMQSWVGTQLGARSSEEWTVITVDCHQFTADLVVARLESEGIEIHRPAISRIGSVAGAPVFKGQRIGFRVADKEAVEAALREAELL